MPSLHELNVDAVSAEERSYLLGLYLADGCAYTSRKKGRNCPSYRINFFLQGDQMEVAEKVVALLKKLIGVAPRIYWVAGCMWVLKFESKALFAFLPNKKRLLSDNLVRERFFSDNRLLEVKNGVPFLAGLLDGDGSCEARLHKKDCLLGSVKKWKWSFSQSKLVFLVDYVKTLVTSMTLDECSAKVTFRPSRRETKLFIQKSGILALLKSGIVNHSWKVRKWLHKVGKIQGKRARYRTVGQVAKVFGVSGYVVRRWVSQNKLKCLRRPVESRGSALSWRYISVDQVEKLKVRLQGERKRVEEIKTRGVRIQDAAKVLRVSYSMLQKWCRFQKIRCAMVREMGYRYWVIPKEEVEKLKRRQDTSRQNRRSSVICVSPPHVHMGDGESELISGKDLSEVFLRTETARSQEVGFF